MSDFGKTNFSISFNPTFAFPLDARTYFTDLASAEAAAATAEEVGSTNTVYYYGMRLVVADGENVTWYTIQPDKTLRPDGKVIAKTSVSKYNGDSTLTITYTDGTKNSISVSNGNNIYLYDVNAPKHYQTLEGEFGGYQKLGEAVIGYEPFKITTKDLLLSSSDGRIYTIKKITSVGEICFEK